MGTLTLGFQLQNLGDKCVLPLVYGLLVWQPKQPRDRGWHGRDSCGVVLLPR